MSRPTTTVRLHTDLLVPVGLRPLSFVHDVTVKALANVKMMHWEDLDDLPDTAMQRFLREAGACAAGRTYVGAREDREVLQEAAAEFGLDWGAFGEVAVREGVYELSFEEAWDIYVMWLRSGETLDLYAPYGEDE